MRSRFSIVRGAALAVTAVFTLGLATAPAADAAPASPAPAVPQPAGYSIHGYNFNSGNYRGAIDAQTGDLWLTSVSPMNGPTKSTIYRLNPNTMSVKQRINVTQKADTDGHGTIAAQYEIGVLKTATLWTTAAAANGGEANVGQEHRAAPGQLAQPAAFTLHRLRRRPPRRHHLGHPGLVFFDMDTYKRLGEVRYPSGGKQLGAGTIVTDQGPDGATVTTTSYYTDLTQFRLTRSGDKVRAKVKGTPARRSGKVTAASPPTPRPTACTSTTCTTDCRCTTCAQVSTSAT